jgi:hypothetical protein
VSHRLSQLSGYAGEVTKAPPWHGWVTADLFLSELSSGTFVVTSVGQLILGRKFGRLATTGYVIAFVSILADLICLVMDLGDPLRFHHMLRRFKPRSPMSLGVWGISNYAMTAFACAAMAIAQIGALAKPQLIVAATGIAPALFVGLYKGVLLSVTAQPVWRDARWLGAELSVSAGIIGSATMLSIAIFIGAPESIAALRIALALLSAIEIAALGLFLRDTGPEIGRRLGKRRGLFAYGAIGLGGLIAPSVIAAATGDSIALLGASMLAIGGALASRHYLVILPQQVVQ